MALFISWLEGGLNVQPGASMVNIASDPDHYKIIISI